MSFSFNFSGDDIDDSIDRNENEEICMNASDTVVGEAGAEPAADEAVLVEVKQHDLREMVGLK